MILKGNSVKMFATYRGSSYFKVLSSCIFSLTIARGDRKSSRVILESTGSMLPYTYLSALSNEDKYCNDIGKQILSNGISFVNTYFFSVSVRKRRYRLALLAFLNLPSISSLYMYIISHQF